MIMLGKYKQGEVWFEGPGDVPCPEVCRNDKYQIVDGHLTPANNQFIALNKTAKYSILPAKGERHCCDLYLDETGAHCFLPALYSSPRSPFRPQPLPTQCARD